MDEKWMKVDQMDDKGNKLIKMDDNLKMDKKVKKLDRTDESG